MSLITGLIGALIGAFITSTFHFWKLRRDEFSARSDELCKAILDASGQAIEYWSADYAELVKPRVVEAKLRAAQALIDGAYGSWRNRVYAIDGKKVDDRMSDLLDALTGGQFSVAGRLASSEYVDKASQSSIECLMAIRDAHRNTIPLQGLFDQYIRNRNTELA